MGGPIFDLYLQGLFIWSYFKIGGYFTSRTFLRHSFFGQYFQPSRFTISSAALSETRRGASPFFFTVFIF